MPEEDVRPVAREDGRADAPAEITEEEQRRRLAAELDRLVQRVEALQPAHRPPPYSPRRLVALVQESLANLPTTLQLDAVRRLQKTLREDAFDPDFWKGLWYMLNYTLRYNADMLKRRYTGEYETDEWGLDWEFVDAVRPFFTFLYRVYWRVETVGVEQIPVEGPALLVANHSGQLPWDGTMVATAVLTEHPAGRLVRTLYSESLPNLPLVSHLSVKLGQALATEENGIRLLEQEEVVAVYPEGPGGAGKPYKERYRLARFERSDFVRMALRSGAPIIPVSVVGAEETYISLANSRSLARLTNLPYFPVTPTFPWLGLLGLVPLPTKWYVDFGPPLAMDGYGSHAADNLVLVAQLADRVRHSIQEMVYERLAQRRSVFF